MSVEGAGRSISGFVRKPLPVLVVDDDPDARHVLRAFLEAAGYALRRPHPRDGRGQMLQITGQGTALTRRMWKVYRRTIERDFAGKLPEGAAGQLARLLQQLL